jgi:dipeptidyl aminopeptidase/acylaminoacyl peptidase
VNADDPFDRTVAEWLRLDPEHRVPEHLDAVLSATSSQRQRAAWRTAERWLPEAFASRPRLVPATAFRAVAGFAVATLLLLAILALAAGSRRPLPPPFGLARNGAIVASANGDIFSIDATTRTATPLITGDALDFGPVFSRDGTKLLFLRSPNLVPTPGLALVVANRDGTSPREITRPVDGLDQVDWSPDGTRIVFLSRVGGRGFINIVTADGGRLTTLDVGRPADQVAWLPPGGDEILFRGEQQIGSDPPAAILAVRPDGSSLRAISVRPAIDRNDNQDVNASPDGKVIAYRDAGAEHRFRVHLLEPATGRDRILEDPADTVGSGGAVFSPDGRNLIYLRWYSDSSTQLVFGPVDGSGPWIPLGPHGPLGPDGPTINNYWFTPDGTAVFANYDDEKLGRLLPVDGSPPSVLVRGDLASAAYQRLAP